MTSKAPTPRHTFVLTPHGPDVGPNAPTRLAQSGGELVGAIIDGAVCTWLAQAHGQLVLMMWPRQFRARLDPLELLDEQGNVVATGGEFVTVVGGFLPAGDPRSLGHERAFAARPVSAGTRTTR
ncbi:MAG: hypothetical protein ACRDL5_15825 [Solirubrobacteraceae bacterium]